MHTYMQHVTRQQAANHRGQVQLNESFYQYTQHQQRQDPSPFPWPTLEQFGATVAWPGDEPDLQTRARPVGAPGDEVRAQEDDDMTDALDYFM